MLNFAYEFYNWYINTDSYLLTILNIWSICELINWFVYLYMYLKIINPRVRKYHESDTENIINRVDKLSKKEIEYIIKGCIKYDKVYHKKIDITTFDIKDLSRKEMIYLLADQSNISFRYGNLFLFNKVNLSCLLFHY